MQPKHRLFGEMLVAVRGPYGPQVVQAKIHHAKAAVCACGARRRHRPTAASPQNHAGTNKLKDLMYAHECEPTVGPSVARHVAICAVFWMFLG